MSESARNSLFQEILIEKNFPFETKRIACGTDEHRGTDKIEHEADRRLLYQLLQGLGVSRINIVQSGFEGFAAAGVFHRCEDEDLTVGGDLEPCVGIGADLIQDRFFDHQRQALSVFGQFLDHGSMHPCRVCSSEGTMSERPDQGPLQIMAGGRRAKSVRGLLPIDRPQGGCRSGW